jgi:hypothetical protein
MTDLDITQMPYYYQKTYSGAPDEVEREEEDYESQVSCMVQK